MAATTTRETRGTWLRTCRTGFWHLRHGGPTAVRRWWLRTHRVAAAAPRPHTLSDGLRQFEPWPQPEAPLRRRGLRVAVILDEFSRECFGYEWQQVEVRPDDWRDRLEREGIDLLFVESAWNGNDGAWQYRLAGPGAPDADLAALVAWCRERQVPTVFWNKEDPAHYRDFLATAALFDQVFTTEGTLLDQYRRDLGHDRIGVLPFAAQPAVHNPVRPREGHQERDVAFAGMYFGHRHPERAEQLDLLLGAASAVSGRMTHGLEIYSRQHGTDPRYQFPAPYAARVVGRLDYTRMLSAYRAHKVFLNVNTVPSSPSMCARRVFEITACGTPVLSTPSPAIDRVFPDGEVTQVDEPEEAALTLRALVANPEIRDRLVHRGQRRIWAEHTYSHRVRTVLTAVGCPEPEPDAAPLVSALLVTNRPHRLRSALATLGRQADVDLQVCLVTHGWQPAADDLARAVEDAGLPRIVHRVADPALTLGECLNLAVDLADGDVLAKIDDDDWYGEHYLADQVNALGYSRADLVGKQAHYVYVEGTDLTVLRYAHREHRYTDFVMGPTFVGTQAAMRGNPFEARTRGEDTAFLRSAVAAGMTIYSADRFGYVQMRTGPQDSHTWAVSDAELLASAVYCAPGFVPDLAAV